MSSSTPKRPRSADLLSRIANALERLAPAHPAAPNFDAAEAFIWRAERGTLAPVARVNRIDLSLLRGVDRVRDLLSRIRGASRADCPQREHRRRRARRDPGA